MLLWNSDNFDKISNVMVVWRRDLDSFYEAVDVCNYKGLTKVYSLSEALRDGEGLSLAMYAIAIIENCKYQFSSNTFDVSKIKFSLNDAFRRGEKESFIFIQGGVDGLIKKKLLDVRSDLFHVSSLFYNNGYLYDGESWMDSSFSILNDFNGIVDNFSKNKSVINEYLKEVVGKLYDFFSEIVSERPPYRLVTLSAWLFHLSKLARKRGDFTLALTYLHRASETMMRYLALDARVLKLNTYGELYHPSKSRLYLMDLIEELKQQIAISDNELNSFKELNSKRNKCKLAHGYCCISEGEFSNIFATIFYFFKEIDFWKAKVMDLDTIFSIEFDVGSFIKNELFTGLHIMEEEA